ncbi:MAG TPA: HEAT repeat domain-containing protein [Gemmatimonadaceae bacterium]|nr:HEAT repeat domain-containing protein [Gemmatimonadaceae bacterium]
MTHSLSFVRHFSRLVWLFLYEPEAYDGQMATLRVVVGASREGAVTLGHDDGELLVNGAAVTDGVMGAKDLATQLVRHGIAELSIDAGAAPADLILCARMLANDPVPGGAHALRDVLRATRATTVTCTAEGLTDVTVEAPYEPAYVDAIGADTSGAGASGAGALVLRGDAPPADRRVERDDALPSARVASPGVMRADAPSSLLREQDPQAMYHAFSSAETPRGSAISLLTQLDTARTEADRVRHLDALVKLATESVALERHDVVAEILSRLVDRETTASDPAERRALGITLRRLMKPDVLKSIAVLLPRRREDYDRHMRSIRRAEEAGIEVLVDALVSASAIADRRTYYDALRTLQTGVRALLFMLSDKRWYVVRNAAELLGDLRMEEAEPELLRLLDHSDDRVRSAAAGALVKLGSSAGARGLRAVLRDIHSSALRHSAVSAAVGDAATADAPGTADALIRALAREQDPQAQLAIITALGQIGTPSAIEKLIDLASGRSGRFRRTPTALRVAAVHALAATSSTTALVAIQGLTRDKQREVRGAAAWVMLGERHHRLEIPEPTP